MEEEVRAVDYVSIKDDLIKANDERMISYYLKNMIKKGASWPRHFLEDADVFNKNPREVFSSVNPIFVIVKPRTEACGKTDGCDSGCWRIMGRDKLIKYEDTGKILGFKKILKLCGKTKPREYKRSWVMEEYRLPSKWNTKQDHVICKIQLLFQTEISFLLAKHFSYSSDTLPPTQLLPSYGIRVNTREVEDAYYLHTIIRSGGNAWPSYVTNNVYCVHPSTLADLDDRKFLNYGLCIFANWTVASVSGRKDGCWRIMERDKLIKWRTKTMGIKTVYKFCDKEERRQLCNGEDVKVTWIMEEYRLVEKKKQYKVICVIKVKSTTMLMSETN